MSRWRSTPKRLGIAGAFLALLAAAGVALGHWTIVSQLTAPEPGRTFGLRLHYELLAGQANPDEALRICFWLERHQGNRYAPITGRTCQAVTLKPNDWRTLTYSVDSLQWLGDRRTDRRLPPGQYRAIALIESDVNPIVRFFLGAAQDQKVLPFQIE
jgi:hypothetical protein